MYLTSNYYDDGISGTTTTQRKGFTAMIENAKAGLIDIILVKSVSRFARNIIDLLTEVRELRKLGVEIYFESQEMSSLDMKSDMMITMYAEYAEEEAISVSENVKWRVEKNKRDGIYHLPVNQMLGYRYDENGDIYIYEEEAKIIRLIYDMYAKGEGSSNIAKFLTNKKYKNRKGDTMWYANSVRNILRNEKYVGDYLFTKSYVESPLTHKKMLNYGDKEQMLVSNGHPAIVDRDLWDKVQSIMDEDPLFRTIFSKAVIVNKKLIYFIVGNGDMKSYPIRPKMLFKTNISYRVRETYFDTLGGIIINK